MKELEGRNENFLFSLKQLTDFLINKEKSSEMILDKSKEKLSRTNVSVIFEIEWGSKPQR